MNKKLRVWWSPQVPMRPFYAEVESPKEARKILNVLADYDLFQLENDIKPDYCNAGGLEVYEDDSDGDGNPGWCEWTNEDGYCIDEIDENGDPL